MIDEIKSLQVVAGEDLEDFHKRALALRSRLELSRMTVPPTLLFGRYLAQLNQSQHLVPLLATYNLSFARHKRDVGDHILFTDSIDEVFDFLCESKCSTVLSVPNDNQFTIVPTANYGSRNRQVCAVCDGNHTEDDCHKRGLPFMPPAMAKKILRYNEIHGSVPKVPKKDTIQKPFKPRHKTEVTPTANMVSASLPLPDPPPITTSDPVDTEDNPPDSIGTPTQPNQDPINHTIQPAAGLGEFEGIDKNYMEYLFPSGNAASVDLRKIPSNYISLLVPTANMADKLSSTNNKSINSKLSPSLPTTNGSYAESDEIFTHKIFSSHSSRQHIFTLTGART